MVRRPTRPPRLEALACHKARHLVTRRRINPFFWVWERPECRICSVLPVANLVNLREAQSSQSGMSNIVVLPAQPRACNSCALSDGKQHSDLNPACLLYV